MTLAEFKAWFEGFTESMDGPPNAEQWDRIKERVALVDGTVLTREVIYRDRYWPHYVHGVYYGGTSTLTARAVGANALTSNASVSSSLMDLGKADYQSLAQG